MVNRVREVDPREITPDIKNKNKGTKRGRDLLEKSLEQTGVGRGIAVDADGKIIAGNHTYEAAVARGAKIVVVDTEGDTLIVNRRTDMSGDKGMDNPNSIANQMALADNIVGQHNLNLSAEAIALAISEGAGFVDEYFFPDEMAKTGIDAALAALTDVKTEAPKPDPEDEEVIPEAPKKYPFEAGDQIMMGDHVLLVGTIGFDEVQHLIRQWQGYTGYQVQIIPAGE